VHSIHGVLLSDDEYRERQREAEARCFFAYAGFLGALSMCSRTLVGFDVAAMRLATTLDASIRQDETALTPERRARYDALRAAGVLPLDALVLLDENEDAVALALDDVAADAEDCSSFHGLAFHARPLQRGFLRLEAAPRIEAEITLEELRLEEMVAVRAELAADPRLVGCTHELEERLAGLRHPRPGLRLVRRVEGDVVAHRVTLSP